jgi:vitamin B12 transporter
MEYPDVVRLSATYARGFRAPTFFDLYASAPGYTPNPNLQPERSKSYEYTVKSDAKAPLQWRITAFDNRFENLIVFTFTPTSSTVVNAARARARGVEASLDAAWLGTRWRASVTVQRPRDEDTGKTLQGRAQHYGSLDASHTFGAWTAGVTLLASGPRFDSTDESPASRLPGYLVADARVRYAFSKGWTAELTAANLGNRRYENAVGYDAPRRVVMLNVRFDAF